MSTADFDYADRCTDVLDHQGAERRQLEAEPDYWLSRLRANVWAALEMGAGEDDVYEAVADELSKQRRRARRLAVVQ